MDVRENIDLLLSQYSESTNLREILNGFLDATQTNIVDAFTTLERQLSLDTASGVWLDYIGRRLGFSRPFVRSTSVDFFGYDTSDDSHVGFDQGPLQTINERLQILEPLGDAQYRNMLQGRGLTLRSSTGRRDLEAVLDVLFDSGGYVKSESLATRSIVLVVRECRVGYTDLVTKFKHLLLPQTSGFEYTLEEVAP